MKKISLAMIGIMLCLSTAAHAEKPDSDTKLPGRLSLEKCIEIALEQNRNRTVSSLAVKIAQTQHKQALSSYWPKLDISSMYSQMDEDPSFLFPEETSLYSVPGLGTVPITVDERTVKQMDRENTITALELTLPIYTGGIRPAIIKQAKSGIDVAIQTARRTDLQIIYDIKKMYYGAVLSERLYKIGQDALARLNATLKLTEKLYKEGSGSVSKTDYLKNKIFVAALRSGLAPLESNREISKAALLNTMGQSWESDIELAATDIPFNPYDVTMSELVSRSYKFNPDWKSLLAGIEAYKARVKEQKGARLPKFALTGTLWSIENSYDAGIVSDDNKEGWKAGIGMQVPIFSGFLTTNKINEAKARLETIKEQKLLLKEGIALQIKHIFLLMDCAKKQVVAADDAVNSAKENLELNIRAYDSDLVEVKDVITAQIIESFVTAQYCRALYSHAETQFKLDFLVGSQIRKLLEDK
jgi:outer membrane protein TolC